MEKNRQVPSLGRIVHYMLTSAQAHAVNDTRFSNTNTNMGNRVYAGDVFPMIITKVWSPGNPDGYVNGQVLLDGNDTLWATSVLIVAEYDQRPGAAIWPPFVPPAVMATEALQLRDQWTEEEQRKLKQAVMTKADINRLPAYSTDPDKGTMLSHEELHRKMPLDGDPCYPKYNKAEDVYEHSTVKEPATGAPSEARKRTVHGE